MSSEQEKQFEQLHELADCILKHAPTVCVKLLEGVEAAMQKNIDPQNLIAIHNQTVDFLVRTISLLEPDQDCIAKIPELWEAVGWLNAMEEHMLQKFEKFHLNKAPCPEQAKGFVDALPQLMHATRLIRRNLEKEMFHSMIVQPPTTDS